MWLRRSRPDLKRPFTAPGGAWTPILGIIFAGIMAAPLIWDIIDKAMSGDPIPAIILSSYILLGALVYAFYGLSHSRLAKGLDILDDTALPSPMEAQAFGLNEKR